MVDPVSRHLARAAGTHGPVMLMYHAVAREAGTPEWPWAVSLDRFRAQLDHLVDEGWTTATVRELVSAPRDWPRRTVAITFDDGYANNAAACEELQRRDMRATWFIVSGSIGREPAWPATGPPRGRLLSAAELRGMHRAGMEIGSHTVRHLRLTELDPARRHGELEDSRRQLEDVLGEPVGSFAYPYGACDDACAGAVQDAGYGNASTTRTGWALRDGNPFLLRRLTILNTDTLASFMRKLYFGSNEVSWPNLVKHALQNGLAPLRHGAR